MNLVLETVRSVWTLETTPGVQTATTGLREAERVNPICAKSGHAGDGTHCERCGLPKRTEELGEAF